VEVQELPQAVLRADGHDLPRHQDPPADLVNKETGEVRSTAVRNVTGATLRGVIERHVDLRETTLHTDSWGGYIGVGADMKGHESVNHVEGEYVRYDVSTNQAEGYFSQLKRSIDGTHHKVSTEHLPRYLAEFDFRYSTRMFDDSIRMRVVMGTTGGRRLSYRPLTRKNDS
jgi:hypothetical protein